MPLILSSHFVIKDTASLDRIDNTKGYIEGNVQWLHKDINWLKSDSNIEDFYRWCKLITNHCPKLKSYDNFIQDIITTQYKKLK